MTTLPTTRLGRTGMHVTRTGFGAWAIGGGDWAFAWGNQDDAASVAAIRHAVESGINWIDTAAVYGLGHSEEVVAAALEEYWQVFTDLNTRARSARPDCPTTASSNWRRLRESARWTPSSRRST